MGKELKGKDMTKKELIESKEFEDALLEGANCKNELVESFKTQNKTAYSDFYQAMLEANEDISHILDIKKKNRTPDQVKQVNDFKTNVKAMYWQVQNLSLKEDLEEGKKSKIDKIVERVVPVIKILRYIGDNRLDDAFKKKGISIVTSKLEEDIPMLKQDSKKTAITAMLKSAVAVKQKAVDSNERINNDIYQSKVPIDLQFDRQNNNTGLKQGDWRKLVDFKAKLLQAKSEEAKESIDEKIENTAADKQYEIARAELVRDKLTKLQ